MKSIRKDSRMKRVKIDGQYFKVSEKTGKPSKVPLTRCSNTMTESDFRSWILSALRSLTRKWKPAQDAWKIDVKPNASGKGKHRIEHNCVHCNKWFPRKTKVNKMGVELDHIQTLGGLDHLSKAEQWIERAFVEVEGYQKLCIDCHQKKTNSERGKK